MLKTLQKSSLHGTDCFGVDECDVSGDDVVQGSVFVHEFHREGSVVMLTTDLCRPVRLTTLQYFKITFRILPKFIH